MALATVPFGPVELEAAIRAAVRTHGYFDKESDLQAALHTVLGALPYCERERRIHFGPPRCLPPEPPPNHGPSADVCEQRGCRKLDLLVHSAPQSVAVELKCSRIPDWRGTYRGSPASVKSTSDVIAYGFLKDIHRMERLATVEGACGPITPGRRLCALLTNNPDLFESEAIHQSMELSSRTLQPGHVVQYNPKTVGGKDTSLNTLWRDYPPFCLAGSYRLEWNDLRNDVTGFEPAPDEIRTYPSYRLLLVDVA